MQLPELGAARGRLRAGARSTGTSAFRCRPELREAIDDSSPRQRRGASADLLAALLAPTVSVIVRAATFVFGLVVVPVWLFYVLKDRERFSRAVTGATAAIAGDRTPRTCSRCWGGSAAVGSVASSSSALSIFLATAIGLTILTLIGFSEFGQFTLVLALIAGVLEWLPIIGPIIAAIPAILIGLTIGVPAAIAAARAVHRHSAAREPHPGAEVMGDAVDLHPAVLIMALVIGGSLFGIGGAILCGTGRRCRSRPVPIRVPPLRRRSVPARRPCDAVARPPAAPEELHHPPRLPPASRRSRAVTGGLVGAHPDGLEDAEPEQQADQRSTRRR